MAITYTTGTINQPDTGSVGLAMMEQIRDDVVAHPAWELVEEFTPASGTARWYVFKCLAAESGLAYDFYVIFARRLSDGYLVAFLCETYTAASHQAQHFAPCYPYTTIAYDASGRHSEVYTLGTALPPGSGTTPGWTAWAPSGTSTKWWLIVKDDGFTVAFNGPANSFMAFGAYTPLAQVTMDFPVCFYAQNMINSGGLITRNPLVASTSYVAAALFFNGGEGTGIAGQSLGFCGDLRYNDAMQGGQRPVAEAGMTLVEYNTGDRAIYGYALGKQKDLCWTVFNMPSALAFGDAFVLNETLWVPYLPGDKRLWNTGVASS